MNTREGEPAPTVEQLATGFDAVYTALRQSPTWRRIGREVYGEDYPKEADPFSRHAQRSVPDSARTEGGARPDLRRPGLRCGWSQLVGGPRDGCRPRGGRSVRGGDWAGQGACRKVGLSERATFQVGEAAAPGLASTSLAGVMSVDAFWLFPDKPAAAAEVARILRPGGRFVCTTWECRITPPGWPPQLADHHAVLEQAGLVVETSEETPDWENRQRAFTEAYLAAQTDLIAEMGVVAQGMMSDPASLVYRRRILMVARKAER